MKHTERSPYITHHQVSDRVMSQIQFIFIESWNKVWLVLSTFLCGSQGRTEQSNVSANTLSIFISISLPRLSLLHNTGRRTQNTIFSSETDATFYDCTKKARRTITTNTSWVHVRLPSFVFSWQNGAISVPDTVQDDDEQSDATPSDDLESAVPIDSDKGAVKFGWIRGVLVSYSGSWRAPSAL